MAKVDDGRHGRWRAWRAFALVATLAVMVAWGITGIVSANMPAAAMGTMAAAPSDLASMRAFAGEQELFLQEIDCSQVEGSNIAKQMNMRAAQIMEHCGKSTGRLSAVADSGKSAFDAISPLAYGGTDVGVNCATCDTSAYPSTVQSESFIAVNGSNVVVGFNSSRYAGSDNFGGIAYSTNGGASFTDVRPAPFTSWGSNAGDPVVLYKRANNTWYSVWLTYGSGSAGSCSSGGSFSTLGLGMFKSTDNGATWSAASCVHVGTGGQSGGDDRESGWVDNNTASPYYGRIYVAWNNFGQNGALQVSYTDNGVNWSTPYTLHSSFYRQGQVTGGFDGTVFVSALNEHGGGNNPRTHILYKSTNGGSSWTSSTMAASQSAPGQNGGGPCTNTYFNNIPPIWRYQGLGQPGVGPSSVVHYAYTRHGAGTDLGDIYYVRSTNNGTSWSTPLRLDTDASTRTQWMPSLAVTSGGKVLVTWYDRRNTTDGQNYERRGRTSTDNGVTWQADMAISDGVKAQPQQPDPEVQGCYAGDYDYHVADSTTVYATWMDGRVAINGVPQQDVYFDKVSFAPAATATPAPSPTPCTPGTYSDVTPGSTFHPYISCLSTRGIIGGYGDCTFRPNANVTRGQLSKIVANSAGFNEPVSGQTFEDVPASNSFHQYVERMSSRSIIGGYPCGVMPSEPCGSGNRPYFRPNANATRGQISKIVSEAKGYTDPAGTQIFEDVPTSNTFFTWIQRLASRGIMGGYNCGSAGEPCGSGNRPYFRPNNNATRGQTSKIVANAFYPECGTLAVR
jgi:hypothetical protein